jgi:transcriptional regulator with XRE-family HTH domain
VAKRVGADVKRKSRTPNEIFGLAVTEMRTIKKLPQAALAEALGYSTYYLGRMERGGANITCEVMAATSSFFNMSIGEFWIYAERLAKTQKRKS